MGESINLLLCLGNSLSERINLLLCLGNSLSESINLLLCLGNSLLCLGNSLGESSNLLLVLGNLLLYRGNVVVATECHLSGELLLMSMVRLYFLYDVVPMSSHSVNGSLHVGGIWHW